MTRRTLTLFNAQQAYRELAELWLWIKAMLIAGHRLVVTVRPETRSIKQNAMMWACLDDLSKQVVWAGKRFSAVGWKDFITAHINGEDIVPNMDNTGFVCIGRGSSTSDMTIKEMIEVIDRCHAFGTLQGVKWSPASIAMDINELEQA